MNNMNLSVNGNILTINGQSQKLDPLMTRLLDYFITHQESIISRQTLSKTVWQRNHASDDAINRGISRLRKILGRGRNDFIKTVPKQGYLFALPKEASLAVNELSMGEIHSTPAITTTALQPTPQVTNIAAKSSTKSPSKKSPSKIEQLTAHVKSIWFQWVGKSQSKVSAFF